RNSLTVGSLKKINNLFIKDIFHGYCLKRQSLKGGNRHRQDGLRTGTPNDCLPVTGNSLPPLRSPRFSRSKVSQPAAPLAIYHSGALAHGRDWRGY
ncbi:MAG: hypothetical protein, partial [Olavius algarvensis Gamma 1 endosymbiont]